MKAYLFIHNQGLTGRDSLVETLNAMNEVHAWRYDMASCFYILSPYSAKQIGDSFRAMRPEIDRFLVVEHDKDNSWGWLTKESWIFLQEKRVVE